LIQKHTDFPQRGKSARIQSALSSPKGEEPCPLILANGFLNHPESFIKIADVEFNKTITNFIIDTFYLSGETILPYLLCYSGFAVKYHTFIRCASHLRQPRLVNNSGKLT
jgi:hypothetical protein